MVDAARSVKEFFGPGDEEKVGGEAGRGRFSPGRLFRVFGWARLRGVSCWWRWVYVGGHARKFAPAESRVEHRFNGAATFQPRKELFVQSHEFQQLLLQWGRDFSAAERSTLTVAISSPLRRFNGAATFQPQKVGEYLLFRLPDMASMGPRLFSRGKSSLRRHSPGQLSGFNGAATFQPRKVLSSQTPR